MSNEQQDSAGYKDSDYEPAIAKTPVRQPSTQEQVHGWGERIKRLEQKVKHHDLLFYSFAKFRLRNEGVEEPVRQPSLEERVAELEENVRYLTHHKP